MKNIYCDIKHEGYDPKKRNDPAHADLRVSDDFSMSGLSPDIKISCTNGDIQFRFREAHSGPTDYDAYGGKYFSDGDTISKSNYDKLYISDPKKKNGKPLSDDSHTFCVSLEDDPEISCKIPHSGYDLAKRKDPAHADLRVSDDFTMKVSSTYVRIACSDKSIKFRFREDHSGPTDYDAYNGRYFSDSDIIPKSNYDKLYISDPKKKNESVSSLPDKYSFKVSLEVPEIVCDIPHAGYDPAKRTDPDHADLRVSDDFSMDNFGDRVKITCSDVTIKFRIMATGHDSADRNAYGVQYFSDGDIIPKSNCAGLYISDPKKKDEEVSSLSVDNCSFKVLLEAVPEISCKIPHSGYDPAKRKDPDHADLRVSEDFSMEGLSDSIKIVCSDKGIEFRFRENHCGLTDYNAYGGRYFSAGDIIPKSNYDKLYISDPKKKGEKVSTLSDKNYSFTVSFVNYDKIRFLVSSDFHLCGNTDTDTYTEKEKNADDEKNLKQLQKILPGLGYINFYAVCGDLTYDSNPVDKDLFEDMFLTYIKKESLNIVSVCEGWGNHDVRYKYGYMIDIKGDIASRNNDYRQDLLPGFSTSDNNYHYHWKYNRGSKRIHFFMLNNVPGFGELGNDTFYSPTDSAAIDERNPYRSLDYLKSCLDEFTKDDYYILFYHIGFCSMTITSKIKDRYNGEITIHDNDRWWNEGCMKQLATVIDKSKGKYLCSFFGHLHTSAGIEYLKTGIGDELLGYRCACGKMHGAAHYLLAEIDLVSDKPELKVTPYSNTGVKEGDIDENVKYVDITIEKWK